MPRASDDEMIDSLMADLRAAREEIEQQRRHFGTETQNYERFERVARKEVEDLKLQNAQLRNALGKERAKLRQARNLASQLSRI